MGYPVGASDDAETIGAALPNYFMDSAQDRQFLIKAISNRKSASRHNSMIGYVPGTCMGRCAFAVINLLLAFSEAVVDMLVALKRNKPCSTSAMPAKSIPGGNMSFSPLGLTPLIGVFDMPRALVFYRDVPEGRFSHWMWLRFWGSRDHAEHPI